jgi:hypothetical protein
MPVDFFKSHRISCVEKDEIIFESSGTGGVKSKHHISSKIEYEQSFKSAFSSFYGKPENYHILALLPGYLERPNSSLVYMFSDLIKKAKKEFSGFYLNQFKELNSVLQNLSSQQKPIFLIGVTFALLDFCEQYPIKLKNAIVMETGGMKGHRKELIRYELHQKLKKGFGVERIHSEYGMTELLSQAYSKGDGLFKVPESMRVFIRDINDPNNVLVEGTGALNIIDLSNKNSCSFIATQDLGKCNENGTFEVLGRFNSADIRGCSLMTV